MEWVHALLPFACLLVYQTPCISNAVPTGKTEVRADFETNETIQQNLAQDDYYNLQLRCYYYSSC